MYTSGGDGRYGISLMNSARNRLFTIVIYRDQVGGNITGYLEIWSYNVTDGWRNHTQTSITNYIQGSWYIITAHYSVSGTSISITANLYNASGGYITSASATISHTNVFTPAYIGVHVNGVTAYFDDFIISTTDPRSILFTNFYTGMRVEVWDNLGNLVNSTIALTSSFHLNVTSDVVVGTSVDGRIVVKYPGGYVCGNLVVPTTNVILGGDVYSLTTRPMSVSLSADKTSSNVTLYVSSSSTFNTTTRFLKVNAPQTLYAKLILENMSAPSTLNLDVWIEGVARSTNITIRSVPLYPIQRA